MQLKAVCELTLDPEVEQRGVGLSLGVGCQAVVETAALSRHLLQNQALVDEDQPS